MRGERISERNLEDIPDLTTFPYGCKYCIYWESKEDFDKEIDRVSAKRIKREWFVTVSREFGNCGFIVYEDNIPVGYSQYALPKFFPRAQQYQSGPPSEDAVFLACLFVQRKELRRKGIGNHLLKLVMSDLKERGFAAIETFARQGSENNPAGPLEFYVKNGFAVVREKDEFPLVRRLL